MAVVLASHPRRCRLGDCFTLRLDGFSLFLHHLALPLELLLLVLTGSHADKGTQGSTYIGMHFA